MDEQLRGGDAAALKDPQQVSESLAAWATNRFGAPVTVASAGALSGGFDNYVHAVVLRGANLPEPWRDELVIRIRPSIGGAGAAAEETAIQNWCADAGYPAARVLALLGDDWSLRNPAQVAVRAPGTTMIDALKARPLRAVALMNQLADLHARLHELDIAGWPVPEARGSIAPRRLALPRARAEAGDVAIGVSLRRVERATEPLTDDPVADCVCHGDFHPLNVLVDATSSAVVIDWTDAALDDPHGDVARTTALLRSAAVAGSNRLERLILGALGPLLAALYLRGYRRNRPVERSRLKRWETVHLLNGLAQIAALGDDDIESASAGIEIPPQIVRSLQRQLDRTLRALGA